MADTQIQFQWWKRNKYMDTKSIIRFQILLYCHLENITISVPRLDCLTALAIQGPCDLHTFCDQMVSARTFASGQSCRNVITKMQHEKLIIKEGSRTKRVYLNPDMKIITTGNIGVDVKCAYYPV